MISVTIQPAKALRGTIRVPGDKSISHRALILGALAQGPSTVRHLLLGHDVMATMRILGQLGVRMSPGPDDIKEGDTLTIDGRGLGSLRPPSAILNCGNSGTSMRLIMGLMAAQPYTSTFTGDASLSRRPMERVMAPLKKMGARFNERREGEARFIDVHGTRPLSGGRFELPVASAQVKSALILAGLYTSSPVIVVEPSPSRDHTERMLAAMGAPLKLREGEIELTPTSSLKPFHIEVPGDFSSAAFFIVASLIIPGSDMLIERVNINPTRIGLVKVLKAMGARLELLGKWEVSGEPVADIHVRYSPLTAGKIAGDIVPKLIDEIPIFAVAAASARGTSRVMGAGELRVKESDRIAAIKREFHKSGVPVDDRPDGFAITGPHTFKSGDFESHGDHRIAMSMAIACLTASGPSRIHDVGCVATSFPSFFDWLHQITAIDL